MKHLKFILIVVILSNHFQSLSVPAYPYPVAYKQPDGSTIRILLRGDEFLHWAETIDGYTILQNTEGFYEYATKDNNNNLILSGKKALNVENRSFSDNMFLNNQEKGLSFSAEQININNQLNYIRLTALQSAPQNAFPTTGNRQLICILIGFQDLAFTKSQTDFNNLFNQIGYNTDGAFGSVKDFYSENSYGQLSLSVTIAGPYTALNAMAHYGAHGTGTIKDIDPRALVSEAVNFADADVNFANFDNDNDGSVDGVYVIFAGYGEEAGASADAIWSHAWAIPTVQKDGKWISRYSCSPELRGNSGTGITRIGVICHEFGHVLGAPDFYDTNYSTGGSYTGTGNWDLMAGGTWNNSGARPAHHNAYTKWKYYNWLTPTELTTAQYVILDNIENNQQAYYYSTPTSNEFWFIENRQQTGFDTSLPGHGMLIYHVDENGISATQGSNTINATHPQYFYPVCAGASTNPSSTPSDYGTINSSECPFPGTTIKTSFTDITTPRSYDWAGNPTTKPITGIVENSGIIEFSFMGGTEILTPSDLTITDINFNNGQDKCYGATQTITVAGSSSIAVNCHSGSTVTFIAGQSITFLPGFHAEPGSLVSAYITTTSSFCGSTPAPIAFNNFNFKSSYIEPENKHISKEKFVKVYPNPNTGRFKVELTNFIDPANISIVNTLGNVVYQASIQNRSSEFELKNLAKGLYFLNICSGNTVKTTKIVIH